MEPSALTLIILESSADLIGEAFILGGIMSPGVFSRNVSIMKMTTRKKSKSIRFVMNIMKLIRSAGFRSVNLVTRQEDI